MRQFQNPVGFELSLGKTGLIGLNVRPGFSLKSKVAVSKLKVLKQLQMIGRQNPIFGTRLIRVCP
jgi:hypothetical protein